MFAKERQESIAQIILSKGSVSVLDMSELFKVSEVTIRKDLDELSRNNMITRIHGGAVVKYHSNLPADMKDLIGVHVEEKKSIAAKALEYIEDGDSVYMDSSSTVLELALLLNSGNRKNITIVTPSIQIAQIFTNDQFEVILPGGTRNSRLNSVRGPLTVNMIRQISADKCFIGVNGIDEDFGFSTTEFEDAAVKIAMMHVSRSCFVVADHSKMHKKYMSRIAALGEKVDSVITDSRELYNKKKIDIRQIEKKVEVVYAD